MDLNVRKFGFGFGKISSRAFKNEKMFEAPFFRRAKISLPNPALRSGALRKIFFCARAGTEQWREGGGLPPFLQWKIYWAFSVFSFSGFLKKNFPKPPQFLIHLKKAAASRGRCAQARPQANLLRRKNRLRKGSPRGRAAVCVQRRGTRGKSDTKKRRAFPAAFRLSAPLLPALPPRIFSGGEYRRFYGQSTCSEQLLFFLLT